MEIPEEYYGFIYKTTFPNGKIYIGQTTLRINKNYFGSGHIAILAIKKYGTENLKREIIKFVDSKNKLDVWEKILIKKHKSFDSLIGYNLDKGRIGQKIRNKQTLEKLSLAANKGWENNPDRRIVKEATKIRIKAAMAIRFSKPEECKRMSRDFSEESKEKLRKAQIKYCKENPDKIKHTEETKNKLREINLGNRWINNGTIQKLTKVSKLPKGFVFGRLK